MVENHPFYGARLRLWYHDRTIEIVTIIYYLRPCPVSVRVPDTIPCMIPAPDIKSVLLRLQCDSKWTAAYWAIV